MWTRTLQGLADLLSGRKISNVNFNFFHSVRQCDHHYCEQPKLFHINYYYFYDVYIHYLIIDKILCFTKILAIMK